VVPIEVLTDVRREGSSRHGAGIQIFHKACYQPAITEQQALFKLFLLATTWKERRDNAKKDI
jgi:hypothetical protein